MGSHEQNFNGVASQHDHAIKMSSSTLTPQAATLNVGSKRTAAEAITDDGASAAKRVKTGKRAGYISWDGTYISVVVHHAWLI